MHRFCTLFFLLSYSIALIERYSNPYSNMSYYYQLGQSTMSARCYRDMEEPFTYPSKLCQCQLNQPCHLNRQPCHHQQQHLCHPPHFNDVPNFPGNSYATVIVPQNSLSSSSRSSSSMSSVQSSPEAKSEFDCPIGYGAFGVVWLVIIYFIQKALNFLAYNVNFICCFYKGCDRPKIKQESSLEEDC